MDNITRFYMGQFEEVKELASSEETKGKALDLCYELRLKPYLSLYIRAHINLQLSILVKEPSDIVRFANEAIDLCYQLRVEHPGEDFRTLDAIEKRSRELIAEHPTLVPESPGRIDIEGIYTTPEARNARALVEEGRKDVDKGDGQPSAGKATEPKSSETTAVESRAQEIMVEQKHDTGVKVKGKDGKHS